MELLQLRYFQTVAQTQNITKAAEKLYISQPALSASIRRLENELDIALFERSKNSIALTEAGRCFLEYVNGAFQALSDGTERARQISKLHQKRVRVVTSLGMVRSVGDEYRAERPKTSLDVSVCDSDEIRHALLHGEADFGINLGTIADKRLSNRVLLRSRFFVAVNHAHAFAQRNAVRLKELESVFLFCSNIAQTYEQAEGIFQRAGCSCTLLRLDEKDVLFEAARKGLGGVFCIPMLCEQNQLIRQNSAVDGVVFIPIEDCTEEGRVVLVSRKGRALSDDAAQFSDYLALRFQQIEQTTHAELARRGLEPGI